MTQIELKKLSKLDLQAVHQIDRSESVERMYRKAGEHLEPYEDSVEFASHPEFWEGRLAWWRDELDAGAEAIGAYDGETMTGIAMIKHDVHEGVDQIIAMYVSAEYRLSGIAKSLYLEIEDSAKAAGAKQLCVHTTPTGSAVGFYLSQGFQFDAGSACSLDPENEQDIPMVKTLR